VFHVKEGREHCHAVWSRVDADKMKGINIAKDRLKLRDVTRAFARDNGLDLPDGIKQGKTANKFNDRAKQENLAERQQKERSGIDKEQIMADLATCWRETGSGTAFVQAIEKKGYFIARGDQRAYVVIDLHGEIHSLSRHLSGVAKSKELKERLSGFPLDKLAGVEAVRAHVKALRDKAGEQIEKPAEKTAIQKRAEALKATQAARRDDLDRKRAETFARHLGERGILKAAHEADNTGIVSTRLAKQPKGLLAFLTRITGISILVASRQRQEDVARGGRQEQERLSLHRRHDRELKEIDRRARVLDRLELRENRAAATALHREEFQRVRGKIIEMPVRKEPAREVKPDFDRAAWPELQRTGTDGGRREVPEAPKKGMLLQFFNRVVEAIRPHHEPPSPPAPPPVRPVFEKAAAPPIDLVAAFNRTVDERLSREDRDREPDGPDRSFDPKNPKN
jgi:hypothetical protein